MRLTTIGTGTVSPSATRVCAGHLVECGDARILMDCGSGVVHRMATLGIDWMRITHLAITHFHADHISDVPPLLFAWRYGELPPRSAPIEIIGPPGIDALLTALAQAFGAWVREPGYPVRVSELEPGANVELVQDVRLETRKVPHTPESVAYSIRHAGRRVVYTGDTGFDPGFGEWAQGADVLLSECSLPASMAMDTHLTPEQCGALGAIAEPGRLVLTHFYPPVEGVDIAGIVGERYRGALTLATDGWSTEIRGD